MITTPTTFVVGAGASNDYGLPTSAELRMEANHLAPHDTAYQLIIGSDLCTPEKLNKVRDDLRTQGTTSIDEFLFTRQDDPVAMKIGRALIALLLAKRFDKVESHDSLGDYPLDWLGYIIGKMHTGAPDCDAFARGNTEVRFVTFNFDSIIEDRLEKAIRNLYSAPEPQLQETVSAIHGQIIHVHGRLPPPPHSQLQLLYLWKDWLSSAISHIRVVLDDIEDNILEATQQAVKRSEILCFLGFAYAKDNLTRLGLLESIDRDVKGNRVDRGIFGTAFGMRPGETDAVENRLANNIKLGDETQRCLDFLRSHYIFRD